MSAFDHLMEVQEHDSAIDRLLHRRDTLPERARLAEQGAVLDAVRARVAQVSAVREEVAREEKRLEDAVASLEARAAEVERALYSGKTTSPRELQAMQADVEQLKRQRRALEDDELEVMERRETLDAELAGLETRVSELSAEIAALKDALGGEEAAIDLELAAQRRAREASANHVAAETLELYERVRAKNNGVGAARLVGDTCQGCHLSLPAIQLDHIKREPPDALVRCDQCGCILVR